MTPGSGSKGRLIRWSLVGSDENELSNVGLDAPESVEGHWRSVHLAHIPDAVSATFLHSGPDSRRLNPTLFSRAERIQEQR